MAVGILDDIREPVAYRALATALREALARGEFTGGQRLPTEADLTETHGLSRQTVRRALQELVTEGPVYRVRGRGTFATSVPAGSYLRSFGSVDDLLAYSVDTTMETIQPLLRRADVDSASRLQLATDDVMTALVRRAHGGVPFSVTRIVFSLEIGTGVAKSGLLTEPGQITPRTAISVVDKVAPHPIAGAHQSVTAMRAPADLGPLIDVELDDPLLRIDRLYYDVNGQPLELAISYFNPDRYSYRVGLSRSPGR
jgi:GntR family transcriptional regulator